MRPYARGCRLCLLKHDLSVGLCNITKGRNQVGGENRHITDKGITPMKDRGVDAFYDPMVEGVVTEAAGGRARRAWHALITARHQRVCKGK
ncbi:MAG TPA: hypothetical protein VG013_30135 [Gemmataceae bacterium]|jgi:succinate dehydrogenase / fumarate reductase iron-sulfur subunit|nr:hypothetical protein [Gemmataceae bacterium]